MLPPSMCQSLAYLQIQLAFSVDVTAPVVTFRKQQFLVISWIPTRLQRLLRDRTIATEDKKSKGVILLTPQDI